MIDRLIYLIVQFFRERAVAAETGQMRRRLRSCGCDVELCHPFDIRGPEHVSLGDHVFIGPRVLIGATAVAPVSIGNHVLFGPEVKLITGDHRLDLPERTIMASGPGKQGAIVIEEDVWIGAGAIVLKGVTVGAHAVVGAGAVVAKDVGPYEIWAGNPARPVGKRAEGRHEETD